MLMKQSTDTSRKWDDYSLVKAPYEGGQYIKQYIEETNVRSLILVDASGSMNFRGNLAARRNGKRLSKFDYARQLAAALAYLLLAQRDAVGLTVFDDHVRTRLAPSTQ